MAIAKGTQVRQIMPAPIQGSVLGFDVDQETGEVKYLVGWTDENGEQQRSFSASEVEEV